MRKAEINKWIEEGGSLPQDLTEEEKDHLTKQGWSPLQGRYDNGQKYYEYNWLHGKKHGKEEGWYDNGQKWYEDNFLHGMWHGVIKTWDEDGNLFIDQEYFYGNRIK